MPIFVELTDFDSGTKVWINTSKVISMCPSTGGGTMLYIDGGDNIDVKETPVEIVDKIPTAAYRIGIGR